MRSIEESCRNVTSGPAQGKIKAVSNCVFKRRMGNTVLFSVFKRQLPMVQLSTRHQSW